MLFRITWLSLSATYLHLHLPCFTLWTYDLPLKLLWGWQRWWWWWWRQWFHYMCMNGSPEFTCIRNVHLFYSSTSELNLYFKFHLLQVRLKSPQILSPGLCLSAQSNKATGWSWVALGSHHSFNQISLPFCRSQDLFDTLNHPWIKIFTAAVS